jgi:hypothetical protein
MAQFSTGFGPQEEFELPGPDRRGHGESDEKPPIVARNIKLLGQGTKVATANLWVRKWRWTWHGAILHRRGDSQWVQLDNRAWLDGHRNLRFAPLGAFDTDEIDKLFYRKLAVEAFKRAMEGEP